MTLSRYQLVFVILVVVVGIAVGIAVYYVEHVYKEREDFADKIRKGETEDLIEKPPPPQSGGPPPVARSTSREHEVLVVIKTPSEQVVSIRGNGEFVRLPALPDEPGPVVTGILDRARVDDLIRSVVDAPSSSATDGAFVIIANWLTPSGTKRLYVDQASARRFLEFVGREMNRNAIPERVYLRTAPAESGPTVPWPFQRTNPESLVKGADLKPESDRVQFRQGLLRLLEKGARFSFKEKIWRVDTILLLPP